jgi:hypothetical protein
MNDELREFLGGYDNSDARLDVLWDQVQQEILDKLAAATDLEAGLGEIIGGAGPQATRPAAPRDADVAAGDGLDTPSEVEAICAEISDLLQGLDPLARPDHRPPDGVGASVLYVRTAAGLLADLLIGLSRRRLSREDAAWQLRLIDHNLTEARTLLAEERARAKRHARRSVETVLALMEHTAGRVENLTPRIMRLFKDADTAAPRPRVPQ